MPYRIIPFINGGFYHIYNRGVEKRQIYSEASNYNRFLRTLYYYQFSGPKPRFSTHKRFKNNNFNKNPKIIEIICYCLMPNHFHLLLKQIIDGGIQEFLSKAMNSYTKYFNTKHNRVGPLLQGRFKAVPIETEEQLIHLSRYIHLNPYVAGITNDFRSYAYSSIQEYISGMGAICEINDVLNLFTGSDKYETFVSDYQSYALQLSKIEHALVDINEN